MQAAGRISSLLEQLADIGATPQDTREDRLRAGALILASVGIAAISFVWIGIYLAYGYYVAAAIPLLYQVVTLAGLLALSRTKRFDIFRTTQLAVWLILPALLQVSLGGFVASSSMVLWAVIVPLAAVALLGVRRATPWLIAFFVVLIVLALGNTRFIEHAAVFSRAVQMLFIVSNIAGLTLAAFVLLGFFVEQSQRARSELAEEQETSELLLRNVLPVTIAERLKRAEGVIAEDLDEVTVLFADIEGFTRLSAGMRPDQLVRLLDRIFSAFDVLADVEGLEKIKTIGDAYMVVGGAPEPRIDHAEAIARLALAMRRALAPIAVGIYDGLSIRIGIDTGPAVAGVIGTRKFIYDLWGDTVNTASRMESHGVPGQIQLTERAAAALDGAFELSPRGPIEVKGKGSMETFFLVGERVVP
ncbi:MAG: adenylate/guanylate cyclase domain-containing protein [Actinomycetota bacterium]